MSTIIVKSREPLANTDANLEVSSSVARSSGKSLLAVFLKVGGALMYLTDYQAKYFAYELTKRCPSENLEKLAGALVDAQVDLNPHQIEAALFAFKSPLSKGAILADEVGLGKTIEAGLVISPKWAERRCRILVITPAHLRKQRHQELQEKFFLPCSILEFRSCNAEIKQGNFQPFHAEDIIIGSYQFARSKAADVSALGWELVIINEAHRPLSSLWPRARCGGGQLPQRNEPRRPAGLSAAVREIFSVRGGIRCER
jgi:SNF2 family DNA or RNA helicase